MLRSFDFNPSDPQYEKYGLDLCDKCNKNEACELHTCPYHEGMGGHLDTEDKYYCNCCGECEGKCADDL